MHRVSCCVALILVLISVPSSRGDGKSAGSAKVVWTTARFNLTAAFTVILGHPDGPCVIPYHDPQPTTSSGRTSFYNSGIAQGFVTKADWKGHKVEIHTPPNRMADESRVYLDNKPIPYTTDPETVKLARAVAGISIFKGAQESSSDASQKPSGRAAKKPPGSKRASKSGSDASRKRSNQVTKKASGEFAKVVAELDRDNDGKISRKETPKPFSEYFEVIDRNNNGGIDVEEFTLLKKRGKTIEKAAKGFSKLDKNKDGKGSRDEWPDHALPLFEVLDRDSDGFVTIKEVFVAILDQ